MKMIVRWRWLWCMSILQTVLLAGAGRSQPVVLDTFDSLEGWKPIVSEGAKLTIESGEGKAGRAMVMDYSFVGGGSGYVIAQKDFPLTLQKNYQFTFDMQAESPVNNFEFKLLDDSGNVYWIKKLDVEYPKVWTKQRIKRRHITFAWGPAGGGEIRDLKKIEFVVSVGTGGMGKVFIDNFSYEPIDDSSSAQARAHFDASSGAGDPGVTLDTRGTRLEHWKGSRSSGWISIDFGAMREIGGLVIDWEGNDAATAYDVQLSDGNREWETVYSVTAGNGGRDYIYLPEKDARQMKLILHRSAGDHGFAIRMLEVKGPGFSQTPNDFWSSVAAEAPHGLFPRYFLNRQTNWTVVGSSGDTKEALINELGAIEVERLGFSLEPFLYIGGKLVTWNDVTTEQSLEDGYLPIPAVRWKYGGIELLVRAFSAGDAGKSTLIITYTIENRGSAPPAGKLFVTVRPYQVDPPWQWINMLGGASRIDSIRYVNGLLHVQNKEIIPISAPDRFGATGFDNGDITGFLQTGIVPPSQSADDPRGFASGAMEFAYNVPSGSSREFHIAVPFHRWSGSPSPGMGPGGDMYVGLAHDATRVLWESKLNSVSITLPAFARPIINTVKSNLAYIFINRDGPGIQPGSRSYKRSWMRDGSLTSTALLELGIRDEVKEFLDWYAKYQFPGGGIPCVVDSRGADPTAENDSHGEFIYAVMQYFHFTNDTTWLRTHFDAVVRTVRFIQSLRAERKTEKYINGTPVERACFGLVPESISHEGYSAKPMHSYWDDFFTLRGLKDATDIATILGDKSLAVEFAAERDDLRKDLYASMQKTMKDHNINYIPGCVELGDFDATSTTIGINPVNELGQIPEPQLHNTFDRYFDFFRARKENRVEWKDYTPYENRVIGSFVYLDQKERAHEALDFFMNDRRPAGWNHWAEVVYRDPETPGYIGDMPHTWCGSDFIRSVRAMFVYERERDEALVVGAGIADAWVNDTSGVQVKGLPTYYGKLDYTIRKSGNAVTVTMGGPVTIPRGHIILKSPLSRPMKSVTVGGRKSTKIKGNEIVIDRLPANVVIGY